jgi:PleD family two-component response regulator
VFFGASLVKRVSAARRGLRPLSVAVLDVWVDFGTPASRQAPAEPVAEVLIEVFREADTIARTPEGLYLVLLEDTPENGAVWSLERLRRRVSEALPNHTTWAGVSCYPAYGFDAEQLVAQARQALVLAKEWPQDRVEVTAESPD